MLPIETTTDENGQFVIPNVSLDDRISVTISKKGYGTFDGDLELSDVVDGSLSLSLKKSSDVINYDPVQ